MRYRSVTWFALATALSSGLSAGIALGAEGGGVPARGLERFFDAPGKRPDVPEIPKFLALPRFSEPSSVGPLVFRTVCEPVSACFHPSTPPTIAEREALDNAMIQGPDWNGGPIPRYQTTSRWSGGSNNSPRTLTWSLVPDGLNIPSSSGVGDIAGPSRLFQDMDAKFAGNRALWIAQIEAAFARWQQLAGVTFARVTSAGQDWDDGAAFPGSASSATRADIRISMRNIDGLNRVLAYAYFPETGDIVIDNSEAWGASANNYAYFRTMLTHEIGHTLGLLHVCPNNNTKLMEPLLVNAFDGPQHDDIRAVQTLYGDTREPNTTTATATSLPGTAAGQTISLGDVPPPAVTDASTLAISSTSDQDLFLSSITEPLIATITAAPIGRTYADYTQDSSCNNATTNTNSLNAANLNINVFAADGINAWRTSSLAGVGQPEIAAGVLLSPVGAYYIRVSAATNIFEGQQYRLTIDNVIRPTLTATAGGFADRVRLTWTAIPQAFQYSLFRGTTTLRTSATLLANPSTSNTTYDDFTVITGVTYYYWFECQQGSGGSRPVAGPSSGLSGSAAPPNNACANALTVSSGSTAGTTAAASNDGAASCGSSNTSPDVWYRYTPACSGTVVFGVTSTAIDAVVSLHAACTGPGAVALDCNDTGPVPGTNAELAYAVTAGQTYLVRVAGNGASVGAFTLTITTTPPPNDSCANALPLGYATAQFDTCASTTSGPSESLCTSSGDSQISGDLWYRFTAPVGGRTVVSTCGSAFDTRLGIYAASCPSGPGSVLACSDNACAQQAQIAFQASAGVPYLIRVGGTGSARGLGQVAVRCPADFNADGLLSPADIFAGLNAYFAGDLAADYSGDGALAPADIFALLNAYFAGCGPTGRPSPKQSK